MGLQDIMAKSNYHEVINKAIGSDDWFLLAKRSECPFLPLVYKIETFDSEQFRNLYGLPIRSLMKCENSVIELYLRASDYKNVIEINHAGLMMTEKIEGHVREVERLCLDAQSKARKVEPTNLNKYTVEQLYIIYRNIIQAYKSSFIQGFLTWFVQAVQHEALEIIKNKLDKITEIGLRDGEALNLLILSPVDSPYKKKENALNKLSIAYKDSLSKLQNKSKEQIMKLYPALDKSIEDFLLEYRWVGYDYSGPEISYTEVISLLLSSGHTNSDKYTKQELIDLLKLNEQERKIFHVLSLMSYIKDLRNSSDDIIHYCLDCLYEEFANRFDMSKEKVRNLLPEELDGLLEEGKISDTNESDPFNLLFNGFDGSRYSKGETARNIFDSLIGDRGDEDTSAIQSFFGMPASAGLVAGRVRIVNSLDDVSKFREGEILVTHMTSPRFMSAIMRCKAIITNEGGLTSHAAIIARELKKPCVIGTKIATKTLNDGDIVEVDANKGIIKIANQENTIIKRRR